MQTLQFTLEARRASTSRKCCAAPSPMPNAKPKMPARRSMSTSCMSSNCFVNEGPRWKRIASRADGPRVPLPEAHRAFCGWRCRASRRRGRTRRRQPGGNGSAKGRARYRASSGYARRSKTGEKQRTARKVGRRGKLGTENTPVRISAGLQQALEVALVCRSRLRRPAARRREAAHAS